MSFTRPARRRRSKYLDDRPIHTRPIHRSYRQTHPNLKHTYRRILWRRSYPLLGSAVSKSTHISQSRVPMMKPHILDAAVGLLSDGGIHPHPSLRESQRIPSTQTKYWRSDLDLIQSRSAYITIPTWLYNVIYCLNTVSISCRTDASLGQTVKSSATNASRLNPTEGLWKQEVLRREA